MASFTLKNTPFPDGTSVGAYDATGYQTFPAGGPPGKTVTTAWVISGSVTFTGLSNHTPYFAAAKIGGEWRSWRFTPGEDAPPPHIPDDIDYAGMAAGQALVVNTGATGYKFAEVGQAALDAALEARFEGEELETLKAASLPSSAVSVPVDKYLAAAKDVPSGIQAAIDAATQLGTVDGSISFTPEKVYDYVGATTVPYFYKSVACRVYGRKAKIKLASGAPRAFDFHRTAAGDVFDGVELWDIVVDANEIGGKHHSLIGTYINGTAQSDISIRRFRAFRCTVENALSCTNTGVYSTATNHRLGLWFGIAGKEGDITDCLIEDCRIEGANQGFVFTFTEAETEGTIHRNVIRGCFHDTGATPTAFFASVNFQVGGYGRGGDNLIEKCDGYNAGDEGVETDTSCRTRVVGCRMEDAVDNNYFLCNFGESRDIGVQDLMWENCESVFRNIGTASGGSLNGFGIHAPNGTYGSTYNTVTLKGCRHRTLTVSPIGTPIHLGNTWVPLLKILDFEASYPNVNYTDKAVLNSIVIALLGDGSSAMTRVVMRDVKITGAGAKGEKSGALTWTNIQIANGVFDLDVNAPDCDVGITGMESHSMTGIQLGVTTASTTITGTIRRHTPKLGDDKGAYGIKTVSSEHLTIPTRILLEDHDYSRMPNLNYDLAIDATLRNKFEFRGIQHEGATYTIESASKITLWPGRRRQILSGPNTVEEIVPEIEGTEVVLFVKEALTLKNGAKNLSLGGDVRLAAGTAYALVTDGTNWLPKVQLPDKLVSARHLAESARGRGLGWRRTNCVAETMDLSLVSAATLTALTSGTIRLLGGMVVPGGRSIASVRVLAGTTAGKSLTHSFVGIYDRSSRQLLATTEDVTTAEWAAQNERTWKIATELRGATGGGTWTPTDDTEIYLGLVVIGSTMPTLFGFATSAVPAELAPNKHIDGNAGMTALADLPGTVTLGTTRAGIVYGSAFSS